MEENRVYKVYPSNLSIVGAIKQFDEYLSKAGYKPVKNTAGCVLRLEVNPYRWLNAESWTEFIDLLERYPSALPSFNFGWKKMVNIEVAAAVTVFKSHIIVSAKSDDHDRVAGLHEVLKTAFKASNPPVGDKPISRYDLKRSIFIA